MDVLLKYLDSSGREKTFYPRENSDNIKIRNIESDKSYIRKGDDNIYNETKLSDFLKYSKSFIENFGNAAYINTVSKNYNPSTSPMGSNESYLLYEQINQLEDQKASNNDSLTDINNKLIQIEALHSGDSVTNNNIWSYLLSVNNFDDIELGMTFHMDHSFLDINAVVMDKDDVNKTITIMLYDMKLKGASGADSRIRTFFNEIHYISSNGNGYISYSDNEKSTVLQWLNSNNPTNRWVSSTITNTKYFYGDDRIIYRHIGVDGDNKSIYDLNLQNSTLVLPGFLSGFSSHFINFIEPYEYNEVCPTGLVADATKNETKSHSILVTLPSIYELFAQCIKKKDDSSDELVLYWDTYSIADGSKPFKVLENGDKNLLSLTDNNGNNIFDFILTTSSPDNNKFTYNKGIMTRSKVLQDANGYDDKLPTMYEIANIKYNQNGVIKSIIGATGNCLLTPNATRSDNHRSYICPILKLKGDSYQ